MPHEDIRWLAGAFLIGEGVWSMFLKEQTDETFIDEVTFGRIIRVGIGVGLVSSASGGLTENEINEAVNRR